jgi:hypothetical protein
MDIGLILAFVGFAILAATVTVLLPRLWSGRYKPPAKLPEAFLPQSVARASIRAIPLTAPFLWFAAAAVAAGGFTPITPTTRPNEIAVTFSLAAVVVLVLITSIVLFNQPKLLVPPYLRSQAGVVTEWLRARKESGRR